MPPGSLRRNTPGAGAYTRYYLSLIGRYVDKGRLLSVGSGDGVEIVAAQRQGWEVEAYEYDHAVSSFLADSLGVRTWVGNLPRFHLIRNALTASIFITFWNIPSDHRTI